MTVVSTGDQYVSITGTPMGLKRPSVPLSAYYGGGQVKLYGEGQAVSYTQLYRTQPWVAVAVRKLTQLISWLPLKAYQQDGKDRSELAADHPVMALLTNPFFRGGPVHLKQKIALPMLLHGNTLILKDRPGPGAPPTSLQPVDWRFVMPHGYGGIEGDYIPGEVEFWEVTYPDERTFVLPEETLHFKWEAPDGALGVSPLQQLGTTIQAEDAAQRYTAAEFQNAARPSGAVVLPADVRDYKDVREDIRQEMSLTHGGVDNAFRPMVLGGGMDWKPFGQTAKEAELIQARKVNREEIAAVYGIPPPMIGILDNATYSNIDTQNRMIYQDVLGPWLTLITETIKAQLIDPEPAWEGIFVEFDVDEQLKGDPINRAKAQALWITHGIYTINEVRSLENLPPVDSPVANEPLIPVNNLSPATTFRPVLEQPIDEAPPDDMPISPGAPGGAGPTLASHLARAGHRVLSKTAAGADRPWDEHRFVTELEADLARQGLNGQAGPLAARWGKAMTALVDDADGDADKLRQSLRTLPVV